MIWNVFFVFIFSMSVVLSMEGYYQPPRGSSVWGYFNPPAVQRVPSRPHQTAIEAMVDLTNNLGVVILQDHSFSRGNFAFSPYGVASVLVVLYEGARGESARQIHRGVKFPMEKNIIRIGFRDIHRYLQSYFSHEGYLSGINLNKDSSTLRPEYKKILSFYGYDVDLNQTLYEDYPPTFEPTKATGSSSQGITSQPDSGVTTFIQNENKSIKDSFSSAATTLPTIINVEQDVKKPTVEVGNIVTDKLESDAATDKTESTTITNKPGSNTVTDKIESNTEDKTEPVQTTTDFLTTVLGPLNNAFQTSLSVEKDSETSSSKDFASKISAAQSETESTENSKITQIISTNLDNGMLIPQSDDLKPTTEKQEMTTEERLSLDTTISVTTETTTQTFEETTQLGARAQKNGIRVEARNKIVMSNTTKGDKNSLKNIRNIVNAKAPLWLTEAKRLKSRRKRTFMDFLKRPHHPGLSFQLQNGMHDTHVSRIADINRNLPRLLFLVDGTVDTPVPMMTHTNIFPYAYIPQLHSKALEFPLDDFRYKLLILLPIERRGLRQLIYDLTDFPLRNVLECLRPARVKAIVPTFMVEGFVILTSSLQKLGIWDVFDPQKANLSGMSNDPELYVRNVEQSVTVVIRNYVEILDIQTRTMAARLIHYEFEATHPFLYFVMDTSTNIALMAGQILNPLSSRIY